MTLYSQQTEKESLNKTHDPKRPYDFARASALLKILRSSSPTVPHHIYEDP